MERVNFLLYTTILHEYLNIQLISQGLTFLLICILSVFDVLLHLHFVKFAFCYGFGVVDSGYFFFELDLNC